MKKQLLLLAYILIVSIGANAQFYDITEPQLLKGDVNTGADESMPIFSKDSSILYFTRSFDPANTGKESDQDIWYSKKDEAGNYGKCEKVPGINNKFKNSIFGISADGNTIYLLEAYEGKKDLMKGCAKATKKGKFWSIPEHVTIPTLDIEGDFYGFHVNEAETFMIISYKGPTSIGEEDLYVSKKEGQAWGAPIHLGATINTAGFEISPFLSKGTDTLFFSSNGLGGLGDADIFFSVRLDDSWTNWSTPKNLGAKVNSPKFDAYFSMSGNQLFWSSNRAETAKDDIYYAHKIPTPPLLASAVGKDVTMFQGRDGKIDLTPSEGVAPYTFKWSNGAETEDVEGLVKGDYSVVVTDAFGQTKEVTVTINEPDIKAGDNIAAMLNPEVIVYFDLGGWSIRPDAASELDRIVAFMNEHPNIVVELGSHTDCRSAAAFNLRLSQNRAASSAAYIKARIKNPNRIYGKGYGESKLKVNCPCEGPVVSSCPEDQHQLNRRTEFIILSNDPTKIPKSDNITPKIVDYKKNPKLKNLTESVGSTSTFVAAPMKPLTAQQKADLQAGFYIVQPGETLFRVHKHTGVPIETLKRLNGLTNNEVKIGQKLLVK
ncbi:MAG: OmpA family protein [Fluviicola sp.]|jgi:outer membrane protein OmpA-like peptidoglycan-associated protein/LysM repeat protein|nr:OmpA family protein [Fluviicola sp.]